MKLWQKDTVSLKEVEIFTVGNDRILDEQMAAFDVLGSLAHVTMLSEVGLLSEEDKDQLIPELKSLYKKAKAEGIKIADDEEDIHSMVEQLLTEKLGEAGKKIHSGRSRNDQVLVDLKLYFRAQIEEIVHETLSLFNLLIKKSEELKDILIPGYTHLQIAMPSSFGLWLGAYAESLVDDLTTLQAAFALTNKNPLGSAAGYGSSFPLNRTRTTQLLGFDDLAYNVVYAQMGRGKTERIVAQSIGNIAATLSKFAMDNCLFVNQNFGFISFPTELTTGSSIMPHKKNPDVWELIRGHCNIIQALPNEIILLTNNLPSGYQRDLQLLKEHLFPALKQIKDCLKIAQLMLANMEVKKDILKDEKYQYLFSVEVVNNLVLQGMPFRDAYKKVGLDIEKGNFHPETTINHTHEGSIGNLCNDQIQARMNKVMETFNFKSIHEKIDALTQ